MPKKLKYRFIFPNWSFVGKPKEVSIDNVSESLGVSVEYLKSFLDEHYNKLAVDEGVYGDKIRLLRVKHHHIKRFPARPPWNITVYFIQPRPLEWDKEYIVGTDEKFLDELLQDDMPSK